MTNYIIQILLNKEIEKIDVNCDFNKNLIAYCFRFHNYVNCDFNNNLIAYCFRFHIFQKIWMAIHLFFIICASTTI